MCRTFIHRLVLAAFVGPCPDNMEACHWNGVKSDNRLENMRWDTKVGNREDGRRLGEIAVGERSGKAKLTEEQVRHLRSRFSTRPVIRQDVIEEMRLIGATARIQTVLCVIYGMSWKWIA